MQSCINFYGLKGSSSVLCNITEKWWLKWVYNFIHIEFICLSKSVFLFLETTSKALIHDINFGTSIDPNKVFKDNPLLCNCSYTNDILIIETDL